MLEYHRCKDALSVQLCGEIDHFAAKALRDSIELTLQDSSIRSLHLDFSQVSFIDSSGVGMIIGRYKTMKSRGGTISASGLSPEVERLYRLAGLHRIIPITAHTGGEYESD